MAESYLYYKYIWGNKSTEQIKFGAQEYINQKICKIHTAFKDIANVQNLRLTRSIYKRGILTNVVI